MNNIGDTATSNEIVLNSFQSQIFAEVIKKFKKFGISGYDIDFESYIVQKSLAEHIASTISSEEENINEIPRFSQIAFQTLTNPDLYDSDIVSDGLLQWLEVGNPYGFFSKNNVLTDLSGLTNDARFPKGPVGVNGFRKNGTVDNKKIPSLVFSGKGSRVNASTVIDDLIEDGAALKEGAVEMWVNLQKKGMGAKNQYSTLFMFHCPGTQYGLQCSIGRNQEIRVNKNVYKADDDKKRQYQSSGTFRPTVPNNEWVHLVFNFTSKEPYCYVNGVGYELTTTGYSRLYDGTMSGFLDGFESADLPDGSEMPLQPENLWLGAGRLKDGKFYNNMIGEMSSVRIYNRPLDKEEVEQNLGESKGQYTGE